jgi:biopolymer transport protein ExbD
MTLDRCTATSVRHPQRRDARARTDLPASLKQLRGTASPVSVIEVRIHRDLPVQQLVETMQMLETAGIRKTAVTTHADEP